MERKLLKCILLVLFIAISVKSATAKTYTWTGNSDTNWNNPANWGGKGYPVAGDAVIIPATVNMPLINVPSACASIKITVTTTIKLIAKLTVSGNIINTNNASLTIDGGIDTLMANTLTMKGDNVSFIFKDRPATLNVTSLNIKDSVTFTNFGMVNCSGAMTINGILYNSRFITTDTLILKSKQEIINNWEVRVISYLKIDCSYLDNEGGFSSNSRTYIAKGTFIRNGLVKQAGVGTQFILQGPVISDGFKLDNLGYFSFQYCKYIAYKNDTIINNNYPGSALITIYNSNLDFSAGGKILNSGFIYAGTTSTSVTYSNEADTINMGSPNSRLINTSTGLIRLGPLSRITFFNNNTHNYNNADGIIVNTGLFTLQSDINGSAIIGRNGGKAFTGTYNVQHYMPGSINNRGYNLLSSPVYQTTVLNHNAYGFTDLQQTTPISGGGLIGPYSPTVPVNSFDPSPTGDPTILNYYEPNADVLNSSTANSEYKGINTISEKFLAGNGFLFYFRGDRTGTGNFGPNDVPENTTLNFSGSLNQGAVNVFISKNTIAAVNGTYVTPTKVSKNLSYTDNSSNNDGLNLVGNPYACTIDLDKLVSLSLLTNPYTNNYVYTLNNTGSYDCYLLGSDGTTATGGGTRYLQSGQGFFVKSNSTGASTLKFTEECKVDGSSAVPATPAPATPIQALSVQIAMGGAVKDQTIIQFGSNNAQNKFSDDEDAAFVRGPAQTAFVASYSTDNQLCLINQMDKVGTVKTIPLYVEGATAGSYALAISGFSSLNPDYTLYLVDNFLKDTVNVKVNSTYAFTIDPGNANTFGGKRFSFLLNSNKPIATYKLLSFTGVKDKKTVVLNWKTQNEGYTTQFTVQRSTNNWKTFTDIAAIHSNGSGNYAYGDNNAVPYTFNQYRLFQNANGAISYSNTVSINCNFIEFSIYPNPCVSTMQLKLKENQSNSKTLYIKMCDVKKGHVVLNTKMRADGTLSQDVSRLMQGTYVVNVIDDNNIDCGTVTFTKW
jgi:hypothetical protein